MEPHHAAALDRAISPDRLGTYLGAAGGDAARARALYVWDRDLAAALLADIAIVEVALRNALSDALTRMHGPDWYTKPLGIDDRTRDQLAGAWRRLPAARRTPGRVVAQVMLGFWVDLLDAGGPTGRAPQVWTANHEDLWRAGLSKAFRGGRAVARATGAQFTRSWTHGQVKVVKVVRNRAAHHEPLVGGVPMPGEHQAARPRITVLEGHETCLRVLRMIDRDLADWVAADSSVPAVLGRRP
jgi:hypothetical protein